MRGFYIYSPRTRAARTGSFAPCCSNVRGFYIYSPHPSVPKCEGFLYLFIPAVHTGSFAPCCSNVRGFYIYSPHPSVPKCEGFLYFIPPSFVSLPLNLRPPAHPPHCKLQNRRLATFLFTIPSRPECPTPSITNTTNKRDVYFSAPGIIKKMSNSRASQTRSYTLPVHFSDTMTQAVGVE